MKRINKYVYVVFIMVLFCCSCLPVYAVNRIEDPEERLELPVESNEVQGWPVGPEIQAQSAVVIDAATGTVLYEKGRDEQLYPASITKVMTTLVALENAALDEVVTFSHNSVFDIEAGSSIIGGVDEGDQMSMEDCLYGIMLCSGNEAAYAVAEHVAGSLDDFVVMMNQKTAELGCLNTSFTNPHGLQNENHYTSAYDMALIARAAFENETFRTITSTVTYEFPETSKGEQRIRYNHQKMLPTMKYAYEGCLGGKTGYTSDAGSTLVTYAERDGMTLICVVLNDNSPNQFYDTEALMDYGFDNFRYVDIPEEEVTAVLAQDAARVISTESGRVLLPNHVEFSQLVYETSYNEETATSTVRYLYQDVEVGSVSAVAPIITTESLDIDETEEDQAAAKKEKKTGSIKGLLGAVLIILAILAAVGLAVYSRHYQQKMKRKRKLERARKFKEYKQKMGYPVDEK